jgi:Cft2 family RNA processing exonuclease
MSPYHVSIELFAKLLRYACRHQYSRSRDQGRLYVDAFLQTHPNADHIRGLKKHIHLGDPSTWSKADDKIIIQKGLRLFL